MATMSNVFKRKKDDAEQLVEGLEKLSKEARIKILYMIEGALLVEGFEKDKRSETA